MLLVAGLSLPAIIDDPRRSIDEELAKTEILDNPEAESRRLESYAFEINPRRRFAMSGPGLVIDPLHAPLFGADLPRATPCGATVTQTRWPSCWANCLKDETTR